MLKSANPRRAVACACLISGTVKFRHSDGLLLADPPLSSAPVLRIGARSIQNIVNAAAIAARITLTEPAALISAVGRVRANTNNRKAEKMEMTRQSAILAAREIGEDIADHGHHATDQSHLAPWVPAYTYWPFICEAIGEDLALAEAFAGFNEAEAPATDIDSDGYVDVPDDDFGQDRGESWRMND